MKAGPLRGLSPPRLGYGATAFSLALTLPWLVHDPFLQAAVMVEALVLVRFARLLGTTSPLGASEEMSAMSRAAAGAFLGGLAHAAVVTATGYGTGGTNEVMSLAMAGMIGGAIASLR
ncbi:MAG: hypothetical protein K6U87_16890 [Firmicutes bacterium]|nr:hypothetical protein [Bacillota bacterium]